MGNFPYLKDGKKQEIRMEKRSLSTTIHAERLGLTRGTGKWQTQLRFFGHSRHCLSSGPLWTPNEIFAFAFNFERLMHTLIHFATLLDSFTVLWLLACGKSMAIDNSVSREMCFKAASHSRIPFICSPETLRK